jgi:hypothetical protein
MTAAQMSDSAEVPACGTDRAYRRHIRLGEDCDTCRKAHNERAAQDDKKRARARAQSRALKALARAFPIEYNALYQQELAKEVAGDSAAQQAA